MRTVSRDFNLLASRSQQVLSNLNKRAVPNYLESRDNERVLYQQFYEQSARLSVQPSLLILNAQTQPIFQSDLILNRISLNYVQTVIKRNRPANAFMKVTKGENDQHFLLFFARVPATAGNQYSVLVLNGAAFSGESIKYGSSFTIADNYDNVFATNSTSFILPGFGKMDSEKFERHESGRYFLDAPTTARRKHFFVYLSTIVSFDDAHFIWSVKCGSTIGFSNLAG